MIVNKKRVFLFFLIFLSIQLLSTNTIGQTKNGKYLRTEASEFWENFGGDIGIAHLQEVSFVFLSNGQEISFSTSNDSGAENFMIAQNKFSAFWAKKPNSKNAGAHGIIYDYTNYSNVGKQ